MPTTFVNRMAMGLVFAIALLINYPSRADHTYPTPSRKEIRLEARLLKQKGKNLQQAGKELLREARALKAESGNRKEVRKMKKEARQLLKSGKMIEQQGRLLRKGKISPHSVRNC